MVSQIIASLRKKGSESYAKSKTESKRSLKRPEIGIITRERAAVFRHFPERHIQRLYDTGRINRLSNIGRIGKQPVVEEDKQQKIAQEQKKPRYYVKSNNFCAY